MADLPLPKNLFLRSIHDVLTDREAGSDPVVDFDTKNTSPLPRKKTPAKAPAGHDPQPKNIALRSIHDVLTRREKNSDPVDDDK